MLLNQSLSSVGGTQILQFVEETEISLFDFALDRPVFLYTQGPPIYYKIVPGSIVPSLASELFSSFGRLLALDSFDWTW